MAPRICRMVSLFMTVTVLLFASYAEAVGRSSIDIEVDAGATVRDVIDHVRQMGRSTRLPPSPMVAVNEQYASRDRKLHPGDEVALIPPVAGG
jgi:sulfur-carrier protein